MLKKISLNVMIFTYLFAGAAHFFKRDYFAALMPPFIPSPYAFVAFTGILYIFLSFLLIFPKTRRGACYGILLLSAMGVPVDLYMLLFDAARGPVPRQIVLERIPFKFLLMLWAFWHSRVPRRAPSNHQNPDLIGF